MKQLNVLMKPASKKCNLVCKYCFYNDVSKHREVEDYAMMEYSTARTIIDKALAIDGVKAITFGFQGGEPTLRGIEFFEHFFEYVTSQLQAKNLEIDILYSLQTNGTLLDQRWAQLLKENKVLVGISVDGPAKYHDKNRRDMGMKSTHAKVIDKVKLLKQYQIDFNVLTVITNDHAKRIAPVYEYFIKNDLVHLQFIPCISPFDFKEDKLAATNKLYEKYLNDLYKLWSRDVRAGKFVSLRFFDNLFAMLNGAGAEACDMRGVCSIQNIIEADGSVFCCDFYATDKYKMGNILDMSFEQLMSTSVAKQFVEESIPLPEKCKSCQWLELCRNGCKRNRIDGRNMYCDALRSFYSKNSNDIIKLNNEIKIRRQHKNYE